MERNNKNEIVQVENPLNKHDFILIIKNLLSEKIEINENLNQLIDPEIQIIQKIFCSFFPKIHDS